MSVSRHRRAAARAFLIVFAAWAALGVPGGPCLAQSVPVGAPAVGLGSAPSFVTETIGWRRVPAGSLAEAPLTELADRAAIAIESEWAPLYRGRDGTRVEQAQHRARFVNRFSRVSVGADARRETSRFRGGESDWDVDAGGSPFRSGSVAAGWMGDRAGAAASATFVPDGRAGAAVEARALLAPGWRVDLGGSIVPRAGTLDVRWEDRSVAATGVWSERATSARIAGERGRASVMASLASFDRRPSRDASRLDGFEPRLAWREARAGGALRLGAARVTGEVRHGEGRQRVVVSRTATPYAVIAGPVREDVFELGFVPAARWDARVWAGRSLNTARGSLALWPFDALAAIAGTRYAAHSDVALRHAGVAIDGRPAGRRGWDGGLALWALDPSGQYESWRATLGLARDAFERRPLRVNRLWLGGVRVARTQPMGALRVRLEAVQWVPIRLERGESASPGAPAPGGTPAPSGPATAGERGRTWGGTVLRLGLVLPAGDRLAF